MATDLSQTLSYRGMGLRLRPLVVKEELELSDLSYRSLAFDANNELHQFLALIRSKEGSPLQDPQGRVTSHLYGLLFRTTHLMAEYGIRPVFIFDGEPPRLKEKALKERREARERSLRLWREALARGDISSARSKAVASGRLTKGMLEDAKRLLRLMGLPYIQAPSEGEAQAAYLASRGHAWAVSSRDYDALLFGAPRLVRYVSIAGTEFLPSKGVSRPLKPELIELEGLLKHLRFTREQLIDLGILMGTDFNDGIRGIGPKRALELIRRYGSLEGLPLHWRERLPHNYREVRRFFLDPPVTDDYALGLGRVDEEGLYAFLCSDRGFSRERVGRAIARLKRAQGAMRQTDLGGWMR